MSSKPSEIIMWESNGYIFPICLKNKFYSIMFWVASFLWEENGRTEFAHISKWQLMSPQEAEPGHLTGDNHKPLLSQRNHVVNELLDLFPA